MEIIQNLPASNLLFNSVIFEIFWGERKLTLSGRRGGPTISKDGYLNMDLFVNVLKIYVVEIFDAVLKNCGF